MQGPCKGIPRQGMSGRGIQSSARAVDAHDLDFQPDCSGPVPQATFRAEKAACYSPDEMPSTTNHRDRQDQAPKGAGSLTISGYNRLNAKTKQHAHKLRQALSSAIELHQSGRWGRPEIEAAGLRDYQEVFGHTITARHFWRLFDNVIERHAGNGDFNHLALYVPGRLVQKKSAEGFAVYSKTLPNLASAIHTVKDANRPTDPERLLVWDNALSEYQRLVDLGSSDGRARRVIISALDASGLPLALTRAALARNFCRKLDRWVAGGGKPSAIRDLRRDNPGRAPRFNLTQGDIDLLVAHTLAKGDLRRAWREALNEDLLSAGVASAYLSNPSSKSYVPASIARAVLPEAERLRPWHLGPRQAKLNGAYITRDWSDTLPADWYQADDTTLPLYYWEEDYNGKARVMRGQFLPMIDVRTNRILTFALHSERNYTAAVIRGLILRTHDSYGLPRRGFHFENGIWRSSKLIKGVQGSGSAIDPTETENGLRDWVEFMHSKPGNAKAKKVERVIGLLQDRMEDQPGYCGRNEQTEKYERVQRNKLDVEAGRVPANSCFLHRDEWIQRLGEICEAYNAERQDGALGGQSPCEAWDSLFDYDQPLVRLSADTRWLLANHRAVLKVTRNGITVRASGKDWVFRSEITAHLIGREVQVYFNPEDLSSCFVKLSPSDKTAAVIPLAPAIPATTATREQLDLAHGSLDTHNRALHTRYKALAAHFPKNAPSPFRPVIADDDTIESGREIAAEQADIRANQQQETANNLRANRLRRKLGAHARVPASRLEIAAQLQKELETDANSTPRP